jgi:hypothetical protein
MPAMHSKEQILKDKNESLMARVMREKKGLVILVMVRCLPGAASREEAPGQGIFWGHDGTVWGAGAISMTRADGKRQMSVMVNLMRWNKLDSSGKPERHPIDDALLVLYQVAMFGRAS